MSSRRAAARRRRRARHNPRRPIDHATTGERREALPPTYSTLDRAEHKEGYYR